MRLALRVAMSISAAMFGTSAAAFADSGVVHVRQYTGDPALGGHVLAEEWGVTGSLLGRRETVDDVSTIRSVSCAPPAAAVCWERRRATRWSATDPAITEDYAVQTWAPGDPAAEPVARFTTAPEGSLTASGPIGAVAQAWQQLPPGHGSTYGLYERTAADDDSGEQVHTKLWIDAHTRLPLRFASDVAADAPVEAFWSYDPATRPTSDFPGDFFAVARPANTSSDTTARSLIALPLGPQTDQESGLRFSAFSLNLRPLLGLRTMCFLGAQSVRSFDSTQASQFDDPSDELHPDPYGPLTFVDADYGAPRTNGQCVLGDSSTPVALSLRSMRASSSMGRAYRAAYDRSGSPLQLTINQGGTLLGIGLPLLGGLSIGAHVVDEGGGELAALLELGETTVEVTGNLTTTELTVLATLLVAQ